MLTPQKLKEYLRLFGFNIPLMESHRLAWGWREHLEIV